MSPAIRLLIVPYGIETNNLVPFNIKRSLLIVPYGIETEKQEKKQIPGWAFNCTLWN